MRKITYLIVACSPCNVQKHKGPIYDIHLYIRQPYTPRDATLAQWSENLCVQVSIAYMHPMRAYSVSTAPV